MATPYPEKELAALAMVLSSPASEKAIGLWVTETEKSGIKVGESVTWSIDEDSDEKRKEIMVEFLDGLKKRIAKDYPNATKVIKGSLNVFPDPAVHRSAMYGFYGWVEVV